MKEVSIYTSPLRLRDFRESSSLSKIEDSLVKTQVCSEGEPVCNDESRHPLDPFFFVYDTYFFKLGLRLLFDLFE